MEASTFGPPLVIDGPLPVAPRFNLLTVAHEITDVLDVSGNVVERWGNGVQLFPYPSQRPLGFDPCSTGTSRVKDDGDAVPIPVFGAFTAYLPIRCTAGGISDDAEFRSRAVAALSAMSHLPLEQQLMSGTFLPENPFLADAQNDEIAGAAVSAAQALAQLEDEIATLSGTEGVIHATPGIVSLWGFDRLRVDGAMLRTIAGTPVVVGRGYLGAEPAGAAAASAGQAWAFASGPILYKLGDVTVNPPTIREALDRASNDVVYRAERDALVTWDTQLQTAILVDLTP